LVIFATVGPIRGCTWTTHVWSHLDYQSMEFFIINSESFIFIIKTSCPITCRANITTNSWVWMLEIDCEYPTIKALWVVWKFSTVMLESLYVWFLSSLLDDPTSNHKFISISKWVKGLSLYLFFNRLLYVSWKEKINSSNSKK